RPSAAEPQRPRSAPVLGRTPGKLDFRWVTLICVRYLRLLLQTLFGWKWLHNFSLFHSFLTDNFPHGTTEQFRRSWQLQCLNKLSETSTTCSARKRAARLNS